MFIDEYLKKNGGKVDYIHGEETTEKLGEQEGNIGFYYQICINQNYLKLLY